MSSRCTITLDIATRRQIRTALTRLIKPLNRQYRRQFDHDAWDQDAAAADFWVKHLGRHRRLDVDMAALPIARLLRHAGARHGVPARTRRTAEVAAGALEQLTSAALGRGRR
jgi:hypothetical protein